ncbi:MAG: pirin family protein [Nonomuraea sp.]|nr:pirin family protein [Nonomuraea sp.]
MSNLERDPSELRCAGAAGDEVELLEAREVPLGGPRAMRVRRSLPGLHRRMIGAWCFVDAFGPGGGPMRVPPHPHTGLQTVSWLVAGEVEHRDSLGSLQTVRPGQLNLMTAGRGISHSEESPSGQSLHGAQLWVALPEGDRRVGPGFEHHADLPVVAGAGFTATVIMGSFAGASSAATCFTPLVGAEVHASRTVEVPVDAAFEHGVLSLDSPSAPLRYVPPGRTAVRVEAGRSLLIGGEPFGEEIVMWWNFVGRSHDDIAAYRKEWMEGDGFGTVRGFDGDPLPAPILPNARLKPRGRTR